LKKLVPLIVFFVSHLPPAICQLPYWQQQINYTIDVSLKDADHTLDGFAKIEYINNSPDTLRYIWFHLWPNAYKNDKTAFSDQLLENGNTKFYFSDREEKGYINRLEFKADNIITATEDHPQHIDITKIILPLPLPPGARTIITTPFHVKLPYNFSRGGHEGQSYQVTQWYPKPAVYDKQGWHPIPYLDQGEFYSEFGNYDVRISVPAEYIIASTGILQNNENDGIFRYKQDNVHDFAWFADKTFIKEQDTLVLPSGRIIQVKSFYTPSQKGLWSSSLQTAKQAVVFYSSEVGEYPYDVLSVVQGPKSFGGGMEYPTITVISPGGNKKQLETTIAHEIGHNWFYGILASNERDFPWMDEGLNSFYEKKFALRYGDQPQLERILFETKAATRTDQPINTTSEKFTKTNYFLVSYYKTSEWMAYVESIVGEEKFREAMQAYFRRWKFKHPQPEDFKSSLEESTGNDLDAAFSELNKTGNLPFEKRKTNKLLFAYSPGTFAAYLKHPSKELLLAGPALGFNGYDKLMAGVFLTNVKLPPSRLMFFLAPMYASGSKTFTGTGFINYRMYPDGLFSNISFGISGSMYNMNELTDPQGNKVFFKFQKLAPSVKATFRNQNPRSQVKRFFQFRSYLVNEENLGIRRDSVITPVDTTVITHFLAIKESRVLNQFRVVIENNRALYPYRGELKVEQGEDFVRAGFTGDYFFNYPKAGGLNVRLFAGKFLYPGGRTITKQFATNRYHLNLTGPNGYEDYTYSDYFVGRNKFEGLASQQLMNRDGGFKIRTELLADKIGKTDDWLIAANFNTTIPNQLNPLSLLPIKIPLKLFFDIGTYAETWKQEAETDRFLYEAGIHVPLLNSTLNIYIPIFYSRIYKDYIESTIDKKGRLWKTISFSIDISNLNFRRLPDELNNW
jgi:hypothetical protein